MRELLFLYNKIRGYYANTKYKNKTRASKD